MAARSARRAASSTPSPGGASATAASGGVLDNAIGTVADGTAIARVTAKRRQHGRQLSVARRRLFVPAALTLNADGSNTTLR